jgi:hypothetical protein
MERGMQHRPGEFDKALDKLHEEFRAGLQHGFFECVITCEIVKGHKRRVIIKAGRSHRFIIPEDELQE